MINSSVEIARRVVTAQRSGLVGKRSRTVLKRWSMDSKISCSNAEGSGITDYYCGGFSFEKNVAQGRSQQQRDRFSGSEGDRKAFRRMALAAFPIASCVYGREDSAEKREIEQTLIGLDLLFEAYEVDSLYQASVTKRDTKNPAVLWRLARAAHEMSRKDGLSREAESDYLKEAWDLIQKAAENEDPQYPISPLHKWYAIIIDRYGERVVRGLESIKYRMKNLDRMKAELKRATELDPTDPTPWYVLGEVYHACAVVGWTTRQVAKLVIGKVPAHTHQDALECFKKAEAIKPKFYSLNSFALGRELIDVGKKDEAIVHLKNAYYSQQLTPDDKKARKDAAQLLMALNALPAEELASRD